MRTLRFRIGQKTVTCTYDENDPRNDASNILELDAKERAEWCVDGYLADPPNFD